MKPYRQMNFWIANPGLNNFLGLALACSISVVSIGSPPPVDDHAPAPVAPYGEDGEDGEEGAELEPREDRVVIIEPKNINNSLIRSSRSLEELISTAWRLY